MEPTRAVRLTHETTLTFDAPARDVFPLLCPVREYEWIEGWRCTMVHSTSGVAELGCVFTREPDETWITTTYDPPGRIAYTIVSPTVVRTLAISLTSGPDAATTSALVRTTATAVTRAGDAAVLGWTAADQEAMWRLRESQANHFLRTGTMLTTPMAS